MRHTGSSKETSLRILLLRFLVGPTPSNVLQDYIFFARSAKMRALLEKLALCKFIVMLVRHAFRKMLDTSGATPSKNQLFPAALRDVAFPYLPMPFTRCKPRKLQ